jgi:phosphoribosyl-dephospho-CoA transferase
MTGSAPSRSRIHLGDRGFGLTATSDLDLIVRVDEMPSLAMLADLHEAFRTSPAPVDCQLDLPIGGVALADILGTADRVLVRTTEGPSLMKVGQLAS